MSVPKSRSGPQQRKTFRVEALLPISWKSITDLAQLGTRSQPRSGSTINISAGGILMGSQEEILVSSRVFLTMRLDPNEPELWTEALCLHCEKQAEGAIFKYLVHLRYDGLAPEARTSLERFITSRQTKLRRLNLS